MKSLLLAAVLLLTSLTVQPVTAERAVWQDGAALCGCAALEIRRTPCGCCNAPEYIFTGEEVEEDVLMRYDAERTGIESVGRVLPREYLYFSGDGTHNYFTVSYNDDNVWDWSLYSPYRDD